MSIAETLKQLPPDYEVVIRSKTGTVDMVDRAGDLLRDDGTLIFLDDFVLVSQIYLPGQPADPETPFGRVYRRSDLADLPTPETTLGPYIVKGGVNMLYGRWGAAKSFLVLSWAASLATATPWNGYKTEEPANVLYWAAEGQGGLHNRLRAWETHHQVDIPDNSLRVPQRSPSLDQQGTYEALATVVEDTEAAHLMIDTLIRVKGSLRENEADELGGYLLTELAHQICDEYGCSVTLVHHIGHEAKDRPRGSSSITDNLDGLYEIKEVGGGLRALHVRKLKDQPSDQPPDHLELIPVADSAVLVPTSRIRFTDDQTQILEAVRQHGPRGEWVTSTTIHGATGFLKDKVRREAGALVDGRTLDYREGAGRPSEYRLIPDSEKLSTGAQTGRAHRTDVLPDPF